MIQLDLIIPNIVTPEKCRDHAATNLVRPSILTSDDNRHGIFPFWRCKERARLESFFLIRFIHPT
jgi:hypothetical protein